MGMDKGVVVALTATLALLGCGGGATVPPVAKRVPAPVAQQSTEETKAEPEALKAKDDDLQNQAEEKSTERAKGKPKAPLPPPDLPKTPSVPQEKPEPRQTTTTSPFVEKAIATARLLRKYDPRAAEELLSKTQRTLDGEAQIDEATRDRLATMIDRELEVTQQMTAAQVKATEEIRRIFAPEYAQASRAQLAALAQKLLEIAKTTNDDLVSKAALFQEARLVAAQAGDLKAIDNIVAEMAKHFSIDKQRMRSESLSEISKLILEDQASPPALHSEIARAMISMARDFAAANDFERVEQHMDMADRHALHARDNLLQKTLRQQATLLLYLEREHRKVSHAFKALESEPNDPEMNLLAGRFLCFVRDDWDAGLPLLARGSDQTLAEIAAKDIAGGKDSNTQVEIGEGWWNVAEGLNGPSRENVLQRSAHWYKSGLSGATGFTRVRLLERLGKISNTKEVDVARNAFAGREGPKKQALLARSEGTPQSEQAVANALEWLARVQDPVSGAWSLTGKQASSSYANGSERENSNAATAMALLAFQGAGNTHSRGRFRQNVSKGWAYLLKQQSADGCLSDVETREMFYTHGQCTIAICELLGMTKDAKFQEPAKKAIDYCVRTQHRLGGWRYRVGESGVSTDSDTSVTGWLTMGLQSGRMAGVDVPEKVFENIGLYLDKAKTKGGSHYGYQGDGSESESMTAEGLLCRQYLGWKQDDPLLISGCDYLLTKLPTYSARDVYYWYHATQVLHHMEGRHWTTWNESMRDLLVGKQEKSGPEKGSWDPIKPTPDKWGAEAGRLYTTCLSTYILEVYYRHLPIYSN